MDDDENGYDDGEDEPPVGYDVDNDELIDDVEEDDPWSISDDDDE